MIQITNLDPDSAVLVGTTLWHDHRETQDLLEELAELCRNIELDTACSMVVPLKQAHPRHYIGSGKLEEIMQLAEEHGCSCIVFDDELSPSQQRNLEKFTKLAVIDRREVILEIFKERASTQEAVLQVQLASLEYSLPRLTRAWTHLNRQRGGAKGTRGEGEKQLEVDRRLVQKRISAVKRELAQVEAHRATMRKKRERIPIPTGALVGYTNAGKSSLLERLSGSELGSEDKLFATLDPSTKKVELAESGPLLLTDTVGFVRNLPHELVDAFHSTLEETLHASFIIHVVDAAAPNARQQFETVRNVLRELGADKYPTITALNKADLLPPEQLFVPPIEGPVVKISARTGLGLENLTSTMERLLEQSMKKTRFRFPLSRGDLAASLHRSGRVLAEKYLDEHIEIEAIIPPQIRGKLQDYIQK